MRYLRGPAGKKPLRVSQPKRMQRSSYTLSLPFAYSIPLMVAMMAVHWLVSQGVFLVQTLGFDTTWPEPRRVPSFDRTAVGHSHLGGILSVVLGALMIAALLANSAAKRYQGCPVWLARAGMNSALIRAFCGRPVRDVDAAYFPVRLGAVQNTAAWNEHSGPPVVVFSIYTKMGERESEASYCSQGYIKPLCYSGEGSHCVGKRPVWYKCISSRLYHR